MSKFEEYLLQKREEAYLIDDDNKQSKTKDEYIHNAEPGLLVAFRLNFEAKNGTKLTKVISGKIIENDKDQSMYAVETRNGLRYGVPYTAVVWVKTGNRWPKGVYQEMKQGSVEIDEDKHLEFGEIDSVVEIDEDHPY